MILLPICDIITHVHVSCHVCVRQHVGMRLNMDSDGLYHLGLWAVLDSTDKGPKRASTWGH